MELAACHPSGAFSFEKAPNFMFFIPCIVKLSCNVNQPNALFNECFNSILLVFYMFRTFYVHSQEDYIVHAALYIMFSKRLCKQSTRLKDVLDTHCINAWKIYHTSLHVQYRLPVDEHMMFETCRRQGLN